MSLKLGDLVGYFFADKNLKLEEQKKPLNYVVASNGIFEVRFNPLGKTIKKINNIKKLDEMEEGVHLNIPKIPFDIFNKILAFFKIIYEKEKTESTIMIFYDEKTKKYKLWVPKQKNSSASSSYQRDDDPAYTDLCNKYKLVMVAHSHPWKSTSTGPSGTDDKDEKESLLYMIIGNVEGVPNAYVSTCPGANRIKLNFFEIFENPLNVFTTDDTVKSLLALYVPEKEIFSKFVNLDNITVPANWIKQCKKETIKIESSWLDKYTNNSYSWKDNKKKEKFFDEDRYENYLDYRYDKKNITQMNESMEQELDNLETLDVIDLILDMDSINVSKVMNSLIKEGYGTLISQCLKEAYK